MYWRRLLVASASCAAALLLFAPPTQAQVTPAEAKAIAEEAYIYGYPLVTMEFTRRVMTNTAQPHGTHAPMGQFLRMRAYPDASFKDVTAPNADTLYSTAWLDLAKEPYVLSLPDLGDRYFLMPMLDGWTNVFQVPGTRTTGNKAQAYAITGPGWKGTLPAGVKELKSPTDLVWILGRTYCTGTPEDYKACHAVMDQYDLVPLSSYGRPYISPAGKVDPSIDSKLDPTVAKEIAGVPQAAFAKIMGHFKTAGTAEKGWVFTTKTGLYGTEYLQRALVTAIGLGANRPQDAVYPTSEVDADGKPYSGANKYVLHFAKGQTPPATGFWSLTMYNGEYFFVANPLNKYTVSPRDKLNYNDDGSLDIYIQNESPGKDQEANWLPAPKDKFILMMRLYWPKETDPSILDGSWQPPGVQLVK